MPLDLAEDEEEEERKPEPWEELNPRGEIEIREELEPREGAELDRDGAEYVLPEDDERDRLEWEPL